MNTLVLNGVKVQVSDLGNSDCLIKIGEADGSMIGGKVWVRVYTKKQFDLVSQAFPNLGYSIELDHLEFHSDCNGSKPEFPNDLLI